MAIVDLRCIFIFIILSIFSPILGFIFSLFALFSRKSNVTIFLFSLSIALFSYVYIPGSRTDLSKWYLIFENINNAGFENYLSWVSSNPDYFIYTYIYILTKLDLSKQFIPFLSVILAYYLYLSLVIKEIKVNNFKHSFSVLLILYFIFTLDFRTITLGVRQGVAISIVIFSIYHNIKNKKSALSYIMAFWAISIHFMTIVPIFIYVLSRLFNLKYQKIVLILSLMIIILPIDNILINLVQNISPHLSNGNDKILQTYTSGYWGQEYANDLSVKGKMQVILSTLPYFLAMFFVSFYHCKSEFSKFIILMILFVAICSFSDTLFIRYSVLVTMCLPILLISELNINKSNSLYKFIKIYSVITFFVFLGVIYSARSELLLTIDNYLLMNIVSLINYNVVPF
ncbi:EpsG family protein [Photobacterium leiognathi]|uniref:EpsG family protein n=1 Tax=Photobacterium leiognathi TaxID=553611 RepID=UPI00298235FE|nr:EpsG family protein [Photobacterium leiognathi]